MRENYFFMVVAAFFRLHAGVAIFPPSCSFSDMSNDRDGACFAYACALIDYFLSAWTAARAECGDMCHGFSLFAMLVLMMLTSAGVDCVGPQRRFFMQ